MEHCERTAKATWMWEQIRKVRVGPFPTLAPETELEPEFNLEDDGDSQSDLKDTFKEGDCLFYMKMPTEAEFIRVTQTTFYQLAEAVQKNLKAHVKIPDYLWEFEEVFAKDSFDTLLDGKVWDHTIKLMPESTLKNCKVYPLSQNEQEELNIFIQENLTTSRICPLKFLIASLVFFIKKKDGTL